jgi:formate dehydrogenase iron-sulfur subunit
MRSLFNLPPLVAQQQPAPQIPAQPQVGNAPIPGSSVNATGTGTPSAPVAFQRGQPVGFFTDTTLCIGCKACEVACKEWNQLPAELDPKHFRMSGNSYDNTMELSGTSFRHVKFIEQFDLNNADRVGGRWLMMSDVCKHCVQAGCLEVCPTGAITRTEFDTVYIQQDVCNGCRYCISACPFGVIGHSAETGTVHKCTFCYDRLQNGMAPACAQACPTQSIQFGPLAEMQKRADARLAVLHDQGYAQAQLYGRDEAVYGGLNAFFLLMDKPETYGLPNEQNAVLPRRNNRSGYLGMAATALLGAVAAVVAFRDRRMTELGRGKNGAAAGRS